jgi:hypothetical protein
VADGFRDQVLGNIVIKLAFRQDVPSSVECWAAIAGTWSGWVEIFQTVHRSATFLIGATGSATGTGSLRRVEQFFLHLNVIKALLQGRCLMIRKHFCFDVCVLDVVVSRARQTVLTTLTSTKPAR